ncbi:MAG: LacI family DNA-binding transcriptional regulator [Phycisphaerae bacterium]
MASVRSIAQRSGVSIATVSRVLNNDPAVHPDTRAKVLAAAEAGGYAKLRPRPRSLRIGLVYTQEMTIAHPYDSAVLAGIVRAGSEQNTDVVIMGLERDKAREERYAQYFQRKGVDGVAIRTMEATRNVCESIANENIAHVVISERFEASKVCYIDGSSGSETRRAVEYLISLGHERIAFGMHNVADRDHLDRLEGYQAALREHGLPVDEKLILRQPFTLSGGATLLKLLLSMADRPTAVVLADPLLSVGAVREAQALQVNIPQDLSIVGFDDTDVRHGIFPTLSAVCQDAESLGYDAGRWLLQRIADPSIAPLRRTIPTFFEINGSTSSPAIATGSSRRHTATILAESGKADAARVLHRSG